MIKSTGGDWTCSFDDEFAGAGLNPSKWVPMSSTLTAGFHSGPECYDPRNVSVTGGLLELTATKSAQATLCGGMSTPYRSGMISTKGLFAQTYGRFEMRAQFPAGVGFHPAFWLLPLSPAQHSSGFSYGEIDVVEAYGNLPTYVSPHLHYVYTPGDPLSGANCIVVGAESGFHTYAVEWTQTRLTFIYDNKTCWSTTWRPSAPTYAPLGSTSPTPFDQPFYVMVELALDGSKVPTNHVNSSTPFPASMQVDYIRGWK